MLDHEVVIIGAGFGGLGAGIALKRAGIDDFAILERAGDIGGTWRDNTYPDVAVDVPSFSYQFSFERNPGWSRVFAKGAEVKAYIDHCADKYRLRPHIRLNTEVKARAWDEAAHCWRISLADRTISARFVISAIGAFVEPKPPGIPGLERFAGKVIQSQRWDHEPPSYGFGCKRPGVSNTYYRTFTRPNTHLVTEGIAEITPAGIRTVGGREIQVETLVLATGFRLSYDPENYRKVPVRGRDGFDLADFFEREPLQAYEGVSLPQLPNAFMIFGPYSWTGSSWHVMVETQAHHALRVIQEARRRGATMVAVTEEADARFLEFIRERSRGSLLYSPVCAGANTYYLDHHGDFSLLRPTSALQAWRASRSFPLSDYSYSVSTPPEGGTPSDGRRRRPGRRAPSSRPSPA